MQLGFRVRCGRPAAAGGVNVGGELRPAAYPGPKQGLMRLE